MAAAARPTTSPLGLHASPPSSSPRLSPPSSVPAAAMPSSSSAQLTNLLRHHHSHRHELYYPPPTSMILSAALLLLDSPLLLLHAGSPSPSSSLSGAGAAGGGGGAEFGHRAHYHQAQHQVQPQREQYVYLLPRSYLQSWVEWAYVQPLPNWGNEIGRTKLALCMACGIYGLDLPRGASVSSLGGGMGGMGGGVGGRIGADGYLTPSDSDHLEQMRTKLSSVALLDSSHSSNVSDSKLPASSSRSASPVHRRRAGSSSPPHSVLDGQHNGGEVGMPSPPPGPIDATSLSVANHALLLRGDVRIGGAAGAGGVAGAGAAANSGTAGANNSASIGSANANDDGDRQDAMTAAAAAAPVAVAVPERFYDLLRSTFGVVTNDAYRSVTFQKPHGGIAGSGGGGGIGGGGFGGSFGGGGTSGGGSLRGGHHKRISSSHGAMGGTVADYDGIIVHHHVFTSENQCDAEKCEVCGLAAGKEGQVMTRPSSSSMSSSTSGVGGAGSGIIIGGAAAAPPQPVEFRRRVIFSQSSASASASIAPSVEIHPIRITYTIATPDDENCSNGDGNAAESRHHRPHGFVLISGQTPAYAALRSVLRAALPAKSTECKRLWYPSLSYSADLANGSNNGEGKRNPTKKGDGYDVLDLESLLPAPPTDAGGKKAPDAASVAVRAITGSSSSVTTGTGAEAPTAEAPVALSDWIRLHTGAADSGSAIHLLIETRATPKTAQGQGAQSVAMPTWSRAPLELSNRLSPGDFVDAQDGTGTWYEAQVRQVEEDKIKVHYFGWASRWDGWIRRHESQKNQCGEDITPLPRGCMRGASAPVPLHSRTRPWRQLVAVGDEVEVREVGSLPNRPRWYRGIVSYIAPEDNVTEITGGAELEQFDVFGIKDTNEKRSLLLLLHRTQQVLVEVEQELLKQPNPVQELKLPAEEVGKGKLPEAQPPHLRWISLYGEEICQIGTHIKRGPRTKGSKPATITYAHDKSKPPVAVLKSLNDMHGQGFIRESIRGIPPAPGCVGLQNLGNSCFMNSIVQCLNQVDVITKYFLKGEWRSELNAKNPLGSEGLVASAYASLLADIWSGDYCALAPRKLKKTIGLFAPQFNNIHQHDSQEFCSFLMDGIHEDLNRVQTKPYVEDLECRGMPDRKAAVESWRKHLLRHDSIIVDHCQGMYRSHVTCPQCGRESVKFDVFSTIPLPLAASKSGAPVPLEDCLEQLTMGEQLDQDNAFYCSGCKEHVCALKMIALWSVPDVLILQLKRFTYDHCDVRGMVRTKLEDVVKFPVDTLDLRSHVLGPFDPEAPPIYKLFGVSEHTGVTANSGHYTATVRNSIDSKWYRFNDSHVGATTGDASITGGAYLLFYQRKKGASRWSGMEKIMKEGDIDPHDALGHDIDGFQQVKSKKKKKKSQMRFTC